MARKSGQAARVSQPATPVATAPARRRNRGDKLEAALNKPDGTREPYSLRDGTEIESVYKGGHPHCPTCQRKLAPIALTAKRRQFLENKEERLKTRMQESLQRDIRLLQRTFRQKGETVPSKEELLQKLLSGELVAEEDDESAA